MGRSSKYCLLLISLISEINVRENLFAPLTFFFFCRLKQGMAKEHGQAIFYRDVVAFPGDGEKVNNT